MARTTSPKVPQAAATGASWGLRPDWATSVIIAFATALALGLRLYQLSRPGYLLGVSEYDDGVYFGGALRLVDGMLPYRDFADVQPPGITLLMAPVALVAKVAGTASAMAVARVLTACAGAAAVPLAGLLVRHRGIVATAVTCGILAVFPDGIVASRALLLEPWLVLACLAGALVSFDGDHLAPRTRRLVWGGLVFGVAGAVKTWAILPVLVMVALCVLQGGVRPVQRARRAAAYLGGAAAGYLVPVLPFAVVAPKSFYDGVVVAQLVSTRVGPGVMPRMGDITGLNGIPHLTQHWAAGGAVVIAVFVVLTCVGASLVTRRPPPALEWLALATAALVAAAFMWTTQFYDHYAAFGAPFLALSMALPASRLLAALQQRGVTGPAAGQRARESSSEQPFARGALNWCAAGVALAAIAAMAVTQAQSAAAALPVPDPGPSAGRVIPRGACVVTDTSSATIAADRFFSNVPGCSGPVDSFGTLMTLTRGQDMWGATARELAAVARVWASAFTRAQYVWLDGLTYGRIPWTPALVSYFTSHFRPLHGSFAHTIRACAWPVRPPCGMPGGLYVRRITPAAGPR